MFDGPYGFNINTFLAEVSHTCKKDKKNHVIGRTTCCECGSGGKTLRKTADGNYICNDCLKKKNLQI